jgi:hypothetical protein
MILGKFIMEEIFMNLMRDLGQLKNELSKGTEYEEQIKFEDASKAVINSRCMALETLDDYFLFFASLNLLNAYTKKDYADPSIKKTYSFKGDVANGLNAIINRKPIGINWSYNKNDGATIIDVAGLQFAFHGINGEGTIDLMMLGREPIKWEGIRLQPMANMVFGFAEQLDGLSNKSIVPKKDVEELSNLSDLYAEVGIGAFESDYSNVASK